MKTASAGRTLKAAAACAALGLSGAGPADTGYSHIFVIVEENRGVNILGTANATNLTKLAKQYGSATNFYAETHPSLPNYIALVGGDTFGVTNDGLHVFSGRTLMDQLREKGLTWKGYFESIPAPGSTDEFSPESETEPAQLYAAKHNGFIGFTSVRSDPHLADKMVGFDRLKADLRSGNLPSYAHIIPNQCDDMHGVGGDKVPDDCRYNNNPGLVARGDRVLGQLVQQIQASPAWSAPGKVAIVITFDEDDGPHHDSDLKKQGCCGFDPDQRGNEGGGRIPTIVITNHGPRGVTDDTPYNHYSVLRTVEDAFGISEHLGRSGSLRVQSMNKLFDLP
jgi:phosphatidylinositol-3-phosphatase